MKARGFSQSFTVVAGLSAVLLLGTIVVQLNALEKRLNQEHQQLRALGESTERLAREMSRLKAGEPGTQADSGERGCAWVKPLHPEVPNFLSPQATHWPPPGAPLNGVLKRGFASGDPKGFNSMLENAAELREYLDSLTLETPAARNGWTAPNEWYGLQACRVEVTDDFKEFTIYLRQGMKWHVPAAIDLADPRYAWLRGDHEVTAHDYIFAFDLLKNPQVENGFLRNYYEDLESWKAVDDYTVVVRWKKRVYGAVEATLEFQPFPEFLYAFSENGERFSKETLGLKFNRHWYNSKGIVGNGPYRLTQYVPGTKLELQRSTTYLGESPAIEKIQYGIYTDPSQTALRMKAREINFAALSTSAYREEVLQWQTRPKAEWPKDSPFLNGTIQCQTVPDTGYFFIGWNQARPLFKDAKVRTAMTLALRRKELVKSVFAGLADVASGPFLPESGALDPDVDPLDFDLDRAKALLADAGWSDTDGDGLLDRLIEGKRVPFEFTLLLYANRPEYTALANVFRDDLLRIGVRLKVDAIEWSLMQKKMDEKDFDAFTGGWSLPWSQDPYQVWHSSQAEESRGSNRIGFRNVEADRLIEDLRVTFDEEERKTKLRKLHRIIYDDQAYTFLLRRKAPYCWSQEVKGVQFAKIRYLANVRPWFVSTAQ